MLTRLVVGMADFLHRIYQHYSLCERFDVISDFSRHHKAKEQDKRMKEVEEELAVMLSDTQNKMTSEVLVANLFSFPIT
jgi:hypothetical protein